MQPHMPELRYTEQFIENASSIELASKRQEVRERISQLAVFPDIGSSALPESIVVRFGPNVRKLVINPFIIIYEVNEDADTVDILALVHQRAAW